MTLDAFTASDDTEEFRRLTRGCVEVSQATFHSAINRRDIISSAEWDPRFPDRPTLYSQFHSRSNMEVVGVALPKSSLGVAVDNRYFLKKRYLEASHGA